ncbi:hypothetical protein BDZ89DRAFT_1142298 [Hymenopellis radicata]|nr:hypothetical protein BDZ89DRAFT_1142298 [Hymenopellis radicata]
MTPEERKYEIAYRRASYPYRLSNAPQKDHPYPEFFTTARYLVTGQFTHVQKDVLHASFADFVFKVRENKPKVWLSAFFREWEARFPQEQAIAREQQKSILKTYINMLATHWSGDGRPEGKDGRMDVLTVRFDILHEMVDDFEYVFPESTEESTEQNPVA